MASEPEVVDLTGEPEDEEDEELPPAPLTAAKRPGDVPPPAAKRRELAAPAAEPAEPLVGGAKRAPVKEPTQQQGRERMAAMFQRFKLDPASVNSLLISTHSLVAGGAALHSFMGEPVESFGGDLDVFCDEKSAPTWRALMEGAGYAHRPFVRAGETVVPDKPRELKDKRNMNKFGDEMGYPPDINGIVQVLDFVKIVDSQERKVQLIVCLAPDKTPEGFDLSAAATSWNGRRLENPFPWLTRRWLTFWQWEQQPIGRSHNAGRLAKYQRKGFTLLPDRGPRIQVPDDPYGSGDDYEGGGFW